MSMISRALKETISVNEVAGLVLEMFSRGMRRPTSMPSDELLIVRAYHAELCKIPRESIVAAVAEFCSSDDSDFIPTAAKLATKAKIHATRQQASSKRTRCGDPDCDCAGEGWYVNVVDAAGPIVRLMPEHVARMRGARPVTEVQCPHEGCHCRAVAVRVPTTYERYAKPRAGVSTPPVPVGTVGVATVKLPTMELWLWECEASRINAEIVGTAA